MNSWRLLIQLSFLPSSGFAFLWLVFYHKNGTGFLKCLSNKVFNYKSIIILGITYQCIGYPDRITKNNSNNGEFWFKTKGFGNKTWLKRLNRHNKSIKQWFYVQKVTRILDSAESHYLFWRRGEKSLIFHNNYFQDESFPDTNKSRLIV